MPETSSAGQRALMTEVDGNFRQLSARRRHGKIASNICLTAARLWCRLCQVLNDQAAAIVSVTQPAPSPPGPLSAGS
jgi:hypothetical protein